MNCKKARKKLPLHVAGDISSRWREKIELHLRSCQTCREEFESLKDSLSRIKEQDQHERKLLPDWDERRWAALITQISRMKKEPAGKLRQPIRALKTAAYVFAVGTGVIFVAALTYYLIHRIDVQTNQAEITAVSRPEKERIPVETEKPPATAPEEILVSETMARNQPTTGPSQERLEMVLKSQESGVQILWVFDKNFDPEGVRK